MTEPWIDAEWIRSQLRVTGKTQRALARALKLDPSAISRLLEGSRQLKAHEIPHVIAFFQDQPSSRSGSGDQAGGKIPETERAFPELALGQPAQMRAKPGPQSKPKHTADIPVFGPLIAEEKGYRLENGVIERRPAPPQLIGVLGAYALFVPDNRLAPRYRASEVIYIHPHKPPVAGSFVVVRFHTARDRVAIGEVVSFDSSHLNLRMPIVIPASRMEHRRFATKDEEFDLGTIGQIGRIVVSSAE